MVLILGSNFDFYFKDKNGVRHSKIIENRNDILINIKNNLNGVNTIVFVANNPDENIENELRANVFFESLNKTGLNFKNKILLDNRNKQNAKEIIQDADLIFLAGGRIVAGKKFYDEINLKDLLKNHNGVVISVSAGSMILCNEVYDFPEMMFDTFRADFVKGLGLVKDIIFIPHFDGKTNTYQGNAEKDVIGDYIFPDSFKKAMLGVPNDSYIFVNKDEKKYFGDIYSIKNGKANKIIIGNKIQQK